MTVNSQFMRAPDASVYLLSAYGIRRSVSRLAQLRCTGGGPRFRRSGARDIIYERAELDSYAKAVISPRDFSSTSERAEAAT